MGNSGTAARLLSGLVAPYKFNSFFIGDSSLTKRPMQRIFKPLRSLALILFLEMKIIYHLLLDVMK